MVITQPIAQHTLRQDLNRLFYSAPLAQTAIQSSFYAQSALQPSLWHAPISAATTWQHGQYMPRTNVAETPEATILTVELPGVELSQCALRVEGPVLVLEGVRHPGGLLGDRMVTYTAAEGRFGAFRWVCPIPNGTMASGIEASLRNGLLTIVLPRVPMHLGASPIVAPAAFAAQNAFVAPATPVVITPVNA